MHKSNTGDGRYQPNQQIAERMAAAQLRAALACFTPADADSYLAKVQRYWRRNLTSFANDSHELNAAGPELGVVCEAMLQLLADPEQAFGGPRDELYRGMQAAFPVLWVLPGSPMFARPNTTI